MLKYTGVPPLKAVKGFTLVELSIVIVIVGLIVAGVTAGASLVRSAQLRSALSEKDKFRSAIMAFKMQYNGLPGDLRNANSYWSGCGSGATVAECNGDGDGIVNLYNWSATDTENLRAWQHLNLAKLIPGSYTGVSAIVATNEHTAVNVPSSAFKPGLWALLSYDFAGWTLPTNSGIFPTRLNLLIGGPWTYEPMIPLFTPKEAFSIDKKTDDGLPQSGTIWTINGSAYFTGSGRTAQYGNLDMRDAAHVLSFNVF